MDMLAKLSRPRLGTCHDRERLFARLDDGRRGAAAAWIHGPPGAGKTTLAASYLAARGLHAMWYQVDAGDADPASFFYYLAAGARQAGLMRGNALPLLRPEYMADLTGFTRRFFRTLCAARRSPWVLVMDNLQEAQENAAFASVLMLALTELPPGVHAILISRSEPPAAHARLRASRAIVELGWQELRLTRDEALRIAADVPQLDAAAAARLVERCDGWAAGLTLLLDHARGGGAVDVSPASHAALFDYFAAELFERLPAEQRRLLLRTALLPWVNVDMARSLSGIDEPGPLLEQLHRRNLFIDRRAGLPPSYQYHALFREFLQGRVMQAGSAAQRDQLCVDSAALLVPAGEIEAALQLLLHAGDHPAALGLVLSQAPRLAAQGRLLTLAGWIDRLPEGSTAAQPWLGYWRGICELGVDPVAARGRLEAAYAGCRAADDVLGQAVAAAGIVDALNVAFADFRPLDHWVPVLGALLARPPRFPDPGLEIAVLAALLGALGMRLLDRPMLTRCATRVRALLDAAPDANSRLLGATRLLQYGVFFEEPPFAEQLVRRLQPDPGDTTLSGLHLSTWLHMQSLCFRYSRYDREASAAALQSAFRVMERHGLAFYATLFHSTEAMLHLEVGDTEAAAACLARAAPAQGAPRFDLGWYDGVCSWLAVLRGDGDAAVRHARRLVDTIDAVGADVPLGMAWLWLANALAAAGDFRAAADGVAAARAHGVARLRIGAFSAAIVEADLELQQGRQDAAAALLGPALALARQGELRNTLQWLPAQMSRLCGLALERGIEPEHVRGLVRRRALQPPARELAAWPWPIKIRTLGRFDVMLDDQALRAEGKAQRRPLALLKALVALGGSEVPEDRLYACVWPDRPDGDVQKNVDVTLHRLRRLLGHDRAVLVSDRRVSLNRALVWLDLDALDEQFERVIPLARAGVAEDGAFERAAQAVMSLYAGPFLDGEADADWLRPVRLRLADRLRRLVLRVGDHLEARRDWDRAAHLYERAIAVDPLAEACYARAMVCLHALGRRAEAIGLFQRCRLALASGLGVAPSDNTTAIHRALLDPPAPGSGAHGIDP